MIGHRQYRLALALSLAVEQVLVLMERQVGLTLSVGSTEDSYDNALAATIIGLF